MNEFQEKGFTIVRNLYNVEDLFDYTKSIKAQGVMDDQSPFAPSFYKETKMNEVQKSILSKAEEATGLKLLITYNYFRIYNKKSILAHHTDRPACEISVTMNIGYDGDYNWPICITDFQGNDHSVELEPGDGLFYHGCTMDHWREDADERVKCQSQVFFHFVDQNGPYTECVDDKVKM